ncbi:RecQ family ATP-dependent DNA helicase [bacterium]|nr:RecQ family ATP-dependent DNA helicase [bacterium]
MDPNLPRSDWNKILKDNFGIDNFRKSQEDIIQSIVSGNDTLVVLPTGGGKSLCYQFSALIMDGTALVVSPLISLMKDQSDALLKNNIPATFINSSLNSREQANRLHNLIDNKYKIVYFAPERLMSNTFIEALKQANISFIAVDEAHCISEWGQDFRPLYRKIPTIFNYIRRVPIAGFTATATPDVQKDMIINLEMKKPNVFLLGFKRDNLSFHTEECKNKPKRLISLYKSMKQGSMIVYAGTRKRTEEIASILQEDRINCKAYHAGLETAERKKIQEQFLNNDIDIIIATTAFGMGIDKPDVRIVANVYLPLTLEEYYQEAGRAGRDSLPSNCYLLYSKEDEKLQNYFIREQFPVITEFRHIYDSLYFLLDKQDEKTNFLHGKLVNYANLLNISEKKLLAILKVLQNKAILRFYEDEKVAYLRINTYLDNFNEIISKFNKERKIIMKRILEYKSNDSNQTIEVPIAKIGREINMTIEEIENHLHALEIFNLIDIEKSSVISGIKFLRPRLQNDQISSIFTEIKQRKKVSQNKVKIVREYASTEDCKERFIMEYFDNNSGYDDCGKCSSCLGNGHHSAKKTINKIRQSTFNLTQNLISAKQIQKDKTERKTDNQDVGNLSIIKSMLEDHKGLEEIAAKLQLTAPEVASFIEKEIEAGFVFPKFWFLDRSLLNNIYKIIKNAPYIRLSQIKEKLDSDISYPELRIAAAICRKELKSRMMYQK